MKIGPNQVHMAPFGLILNQNRSHMVWDASGMPPGLHPPSKNQKIQEIHEIVENPEFPYFPPISFVGYRALLTLSVAGAVRCCLLR